ncbi:UNVERIFIED_ORG: putative PurR-regulated permease PerM [Nocardia globerula]|uniref:Putative PurR-regulated permease PerM n=1 Tax=Nocardia globerula TaxID=1818 RepID=A0A652YPB8_NOCGL|nr:AI-2E family transporter [Rhodococcus globerulus]NMD62906.1 AI-2E family transporter [Nocardia globerula]PVX68359.1 putative PurR-regulated permease PerM [Rhodococcus globerulus]
MFSKRAPAPVPVPAPAPTVTGSEHWSIPRGLIVLLGAAATVVAVAGMKGFSGILGPVFLALMLTVAVQPIQDWAQKHSWPKWLGMLGALVTVYLILIGLAASLVVSTAQLATILPEYSDKMGALLDEARSSLASFGVDTEQIQNTVSSIDLTKVLGVVETALEGLLGVFSDLVFILALLLFMAFDGMSIRSRLHILAEERPEISYALSTFAKGTRKYLVVSTVFGLIVAVLDGGALWLMGIPLPILWALLSFITNYIPNIGFVIGVIPPALLGLLEGGPWLMVWVIVVYSVINFVIQSIIQPKFVGDAVGLSVTMTFLSLIFWSWVLGALGALLAIPLSLLVKAVLLDIDPSTRWADILISGPKEVAKPPDAVEEPEVDEEPPEEQSRVNTEPTSG